MNALTWLALGLAVLLTPMTSPVAVRAHALVERGRLATDSGQLVGLPAGRLPLRVWLVAAAVSGVLATVAVTVLAGGTLGLAAAVGSGTVGRLVLVALRSRTTRVHEAELLSAVRLIAAELEAGGRPAMALEAAAEACPQHRAALTTAAEACRHGGDLPLDAPALSGLAHAWRIATVTGAPLAAVIRRVGDDLAGRTDQRRRVSSAVAGARSSAAMLAGLPVLGLLLGAAMQARPLDVLLGSPSGRLLCLVGVTLDCAGVLWTQRLTSHAERA